MVLVRFHRSSWHPLVPGLFSNGEIGPRQDEWYQKHDEDDREYQIKAAYEIGSEFFGYCSVVALMGQ